MKAGPASILLAVLALVSSAASPAPNHRASNGSSREYVPVAEWARANGLAARWLKRDENLELTGPSARISLTVDSYDATVNGVRVRLLFPVMDRNGSVYISQLDTQTTFHPILYPPANPPAARIRTIVLDPGHGGKDPGFEVSGHQEKKFTLLLAQELRDQLTRAGFKVSLTRTRDTDVDLPTRPELAGRRRADLFVSLHFNAFPAQPAAVQGVEIYCLTPAGAASSNARGEGAGAGWFPGNANNEKNMYLAYQLQKSVTQGLGAEDREVRRARYWVLRDAAMPAVLIEGGYMSHPTEGRKIFDAAYRRQMARAIVDGLLAYKRVVERQMAPMPGTATPVARPSTAVRRPGPA